MIEGSVRPARWRPLLSGAARVQARRTVRAIVRGIGARMRDRPLGRGGLSRGDASLSGGSAGIALLFAYADAAGPGSRTRVAHVLDAAVDAVASQRMGASLYGGFTGIAWTVAHLRRSTAADPEDDPNEEIDRALVTLLATRRWRGDYDLVSGLVGFGVYALERLPRPSAVECLDRIVGHLERSAEETADGTTWLSRAADLPPSFREGLPARYYNLGLAHGVPGVIALLGAMCGAGVVRKRARALLGSTVSWLLAQKLPDDRPSVFSTRVERGAEIGKPARSAWCYGDPGVAAALLVAARGANEPSWEREALVVARRAAARPAELAGVRDAGLCHGAAGLAHVFNRLAQATGDRALRAAARSWFARALSMRRPGLGIAGFRSLVPTRRGTRWCDETGVLTGAAGIALALEAACSTVEPEWDRFLLVSACERTMPDCT